MDHVGYSQSAAIRSPLSLVCLVIFEHLSLLSDRSYFEERTNLGGRAKKLIEIAEKLSIQLE